MIRRKIISQVVSLFSSSFVFHWPAFFPAQRLLALPCFDARMITYPALSNIRDYACWRQADCIPIALLRLTSIPGHINNLYNTCFWSLVQAGESTAAAHQQLKVFPSRVSRFDTYAEHLRRREERAALRSIQGQLCPPTGHLPQGLSGVPRSRMYIHPIMASHVWQVDDTAEGPSGGRQRYAPRVVHEDVIGDEFWHRHPRRTLPLGSAYGFIDILEEGLP